MKINIVTYGCSKNVVDSEHLMAQLSTEGVDLAFDSNEDGFDAVVVNTCGFIADAKQESIDAILAWAAAKDEGRIGRLYVMGCLSERYRQELPVEIPEVDGWFGVDDLRLIVETLGRDYRVQAEQQRVLTTPSHYAYLKISEGCNWGCSYCIIPHIRGRHRSVPVERLLEEARGLAAKGVKELIVIAQDTTYYGLDIYGERRLGMLLRELCTVDGIEWVRLHYAYPAHFPADVIEAMRDEPRICKYLDIPLQHISDNQLRIMRRGIGKRETLDLIARLRREVPGIGLRTTLLVGHPGESEADFAELEELVRTACFERLGVFAYSPEEGTHSAGNLADDVPEEEKQRRVERLMELQSTISLDSNVSKVGRTLRVLIDSKEGEYYIGRTGWDSPEVDQEVLITSRRRLSPGTFCHVTVTGAEEYDLYAEETGALRGDLQSRKTD